MARINHVKSYRGKILCQHPIEGEPFPTCGLHKRLHGSDTHAFDPGALECSKCSKEIKVGDSYKWTAPRTSRASSGYKKVACANCNFRPSDTMASMYGGQLADLQDDASSLIPSPPDEGTEDEWDEYVADVQTWCQDTAEEAREIVEALTESADNMEEGFGHETGPSSALRERAEELEGQCDELEGGTHEPAFDDDNWDQLQEIHAEAADLLGSLDV